MESTKYSEVKSEHPYASAGFLSKAFHCWLFPLFYRRLKTGLTEKDIFLPLASHDSTKLGDKLEETWLHELKQKKDPSLWRVLWTVFRKELCLLGCLFLFMEFIVRLSQPLLISKLLSYYNADSKTTLEEAYSYAGLIVLTSFVNVLGTHCYAFKMFHLGMKIRVAVCSLIYRKALKLSKSSLAHTTIGQMVNLLSNDVSRFDTTTPHLHSLWVSPIEAAIVIYLLYIYVGVTAMAGVLFLILLIPFQMWLGKKISTYRLKTAICSDDRIRLMNEIISGIEVIKMYTWEKPFAKLAELSRRNEIQQIRNMSLIRATTISLSLFLNRIAIFLCLLTYVLTGNVPTSQYVYTLSSLYGILRRAVILLFPQGVAQVAETHISIKRIRQFLLHEELEWEKCDPNLSHPELIIEKPEINLKNVSVKWIKDSSEPSLSGVTITVASREMAAIVGPVGSGKTTILHVMLKELIPIGGVVDIQGQISYASQEPWLFGGSIKENILFGEMFNLRKYEEVVRVCSLQRDFTLFPYGDSTLVGERGLSLSGGQKARINLARAVYKEADIYLLDDPLSAVDAHVGKDIFEECITGYLKKKIVILVTHQLQYLKNISKIYVLDNGKTVTEGSYDEVQNCNIEFAKHFDVKTEDIPGEINRTHSLIYNVNNNNDDLEEKNIKIDEQIEEKEGREAGKISWDVYKAFILSGGHWCKMLTLLLSFFVAQIVSSCCDLFLNFWVNVEQMRSEMKENASRVILPYKDTSENKILQLSFSTEQNCILIYSCLVGLTIIIILSRSLFFYRFCLKASLRLHNKMFTKILNAPMRFFNINPSGRILNRFSKDMGLIDEALPLALLETIQIAITVLAVTMLVGWVNPWMFLVTVIILVIFYFLRIGYLSTSRDIKRFESITRSPVYSHLNISLQGLTTIRAFKAQNLLRDEFDDHQNTHSSAYFLFLAATRSFGFWLDLHCVIYIGLVVLSFFFIQNEAFGGNVGLAITQALTMTGLFQWGMRQWSELENQMTSVERVKEYADLIPESNENKNKPPKDWPEKGAIKFENVCLKYSFFEPYVLKNLSFKIKSMEKVGIVGRTGAGKSSLTSALFLLAEIDGRVMIDYVDTKSIPLEVLRSKISIIPQEPVLFTGTIRKNLDPFDLYEDERLWSALEEVELKQVIADLPDSLQSRVSEGGSNFSVGQRQLICLARAILRNNKILILDEATANVDPQTDLLIQSTIRKKFAECTVLTIAHRLHTVMDSDKVLVMDAGELAEFEHPFLLLENRNSLFYSLVKQTGKFTAKKLKEIAEENYQRTVQT